MKWSLFLLPCCFLLLSAQGQSQMEKNRNAKMQYERADKELNTVYEQVLKKYKHSPKLIKNLKMAQRLWVELKLAELSVKFPDIDSDPYESYGDQFPQCYYTYQTRLVQTRINELRRWLEDSAGIGCRGFGKSQ